MVGLQLVVVEVGVVRRREERLAPAEEDIDDGAAAVEGGGGGAVEGVDVGVEGDAADDEVRQRLEVDGRRVRRVFGDDDGVGGADVAGDVDAAQSEGRLRVLRQADGEGAVARDERERPAVSRHLVVREVGVGGPDVEEEGEVVGVDDVLGVAASDDGRCRRRDVEDDARDGFGAGVAGFVDPAHAYVVGALVGEQQVNVQAAGRRERDDVDAVEELVAQQVRVDR